MAVEVREVYTPERDELYARGEMLRWMTEMGWSQDIRDEILYRDNPTPQTVRRLVYWHGPDRAYQLLCEML